MKLTVAPVRLGIERERRIAGPNLRPASVASREECNLGGEAGSTAEMADYAQTAVLAVHTELASGIARQ
ncbi:MAG TPA: hypothetical protein VI094_14735 [Propionibacteriaceae bacterium]